MSGLSAPLRAWLLSAGVMFTGCAGLPAPAPRWLPPGEAGWLTGETERLLLYHEYLRKLDPTRLAAEHTRTREEFARTQADGDRLRLALVLSLPQTSFSNPAQAQALLEPLLARGATRNTQLFPLARLVHDALGEQRRLDGLLTTANQRLREERRRAESAEQLSTDLQNAQLKLREEQNRADALEKKLQELRLIEKSMSDRPRPVPKTP